MSWANSDCCHWKPAMLCKCIAYQVSTDLQAGTPGFCVPDMDSMVLPSGPSKICSMMHCQPLFDRVRLSYSRVTWTLHCIPLPNVP